MAVERVIRQENLLENVTGTGRALRDELSEAFRDHPHVGDIRGRGLLLGIELVQDRESKAPIRAELGLPETIRRTAMHHGLICYPGGGTENDSKPGLAAYEFRRGTGCACRRLQ